MINSAVNYIHSSLFNPIVPNEFALPEGALIKANLKAIEFNGSWENVSSWKITFLNHTNFEIDFDGNGWLKVNDRTALILEVNEIYTHKPLHQVIIAYCMENYPALLFVEIKYKIINFFSTNLIHQKLFIDFDKKKWIGPSSVYPRQFSDDKIAEISKIFTQRRTSLELVLKSYSDPDSALSKLQIPKDIIGLIAMQYNNVLKSEMQ